MVAARPRRWRVISIFLWTNFVLPLFPPSGQALHPMRPIVHFDGSRQPQGFSVRQAFAGKHVMLIGVTGFIGKVWLVNTLMELPEIGRIYLLIRRQKSNPAARRFEKLVEESPVFDPLYERYGADLPRFCSEKVEVVEGDVTQPGLGLAPEVGAIICRRNLDLIINSSGLTDFNPDLRDALDHQRRCGRERARVCPRSPTMPGCCIFPLAMWPVRGTAGWVRSLRRTTRRRASRISMPKRNGERCMHLIKQAEAARRRPGSNRRACAAGARSKSTPPRICKGAALDNQIRKNRIRWLQDLSDRSRHAAGQGTGLAEYLHADQESGRVADLRSTARDCRSRSCVRRSSKLRCSKPFRGWNEGINTSASLSYLLGTYFRQLPTNEKQAAGHHSGGRGLPRHDPDRARRSWSGGMTRCISWRHR